MGSPHLGGEFPDGFDLNERAFPDPRARLAGLTPRVAVDQFRPEGEQTALVGPSRMNRAAVLPQKTTRRVAMYAEPPQMGSAVNEPALELRGGEV